MNKKISIGIIITLFFLGFLFFKKEERIDLDDVERVEVEGYVSWISENGILIREDARDSLWLDINTETRIFGIKGDILKVEELEIEDKIKAQIGSIVLDTYPTQAIAFEIIVIQKKENLFGFLSSEVIPILEEIPKQIVECAYSVEGIPSPKGIAFTPDGDEFWITSLMNKSRGVIVFETKNGTHKKDIVLPDGGGVEIIFNKEGSRAYISQMETARIFEVDVKTKEIVRILETGSAWTKVLTISTNNVIYASNWSGNNVSAINLEDGKLIDIIATVETPRGIYTTKDGKKLYVAGFKNGEIQKINLETKESEIIYRNGGAMRHIVGDEDKGVLYVSDMANNLIYQVDIKSNEVKEFVETENNPNTIALTPDKKVLVVSNRGLNNLSGNYYIPGPEWGTVIFFDTSNGEMLDVIVAGNQPTALDVAQSGRYFGYSNFLDGNIEICKMPNYDEFIKGDGGRSLLYQDMIKK